MSSASCSALGALAVLLLSIILATTAGTEGDVTSIPRITSTPFTSSPSTLASSSSPSTTTNVVTDHRLARANVTVSSQGPSSTVTETTTPSSSTGNPEITGTAASIGNLQSAPPLQTLIRNPPNYLPSTQPPPLFRIITSAPVPQPPEGLVPSTARCNSSNPSLRTSSFIIAATSARPVVTANEETARATMTTAATLLKVMATADPSRQERLIGFALVNTMELTTTAKVKITDAANQPLRERFVGFVLENTMTSTAKAKITDALNLPHHERLVGLALQNATDSTMMTSTTSTAKAKVTDPVNPPHQERLVGLALDSTTETTPSTTTKAKVTDAVNPPRQERLVGLALESTTKETTSTTTNAKVTDAVNPPHQERLVGLALDSTTETTPSTTTKAKVTDAVNPPRQERLVGLALESTTKETTSTTTNAKVTDAVNLPHQERLVGLALENTMESTGSSAEALVLSGEEASSEAPTRSLDLSTERESSVPTTTVTVETRTTASTPSPGMPGKSIGGSKTRNDLIGEIKSSQKINRNQGYMGGRIVKPNIVGSLGKYTPYFEDGLEELNVTARIGNTVILDCPIGMLGNKTVTWSYHSADVIRLLTVGRNAYSVDERISLYFRYPTNWRLRVQYASPRDSGLYECQVATYPPLVRKIHLLVTAPILVIMDDSGRIKSGERHLKAGSALRLRCEARDVPEHYNETVIWTRGDEILSEDVSENRTTEYLDGREIQVIVTTLVIEKATPRHAGNYSCVVPEKAKATVAVHVLNGELPAAVHDGNGVSRSVLNLWLIHLTVSYVFSR